jgi:hypothetical protein
MTRYWSAHSDLDWYEETEGNHTMTEADFIRAIVNETLPEESGGEEATYTIDELRASIARMESVSVPTATERAQLSAMRADLAQMVAEALRQRDRFRAALRQIAEIKQ